MYFWQRDEVSVCPAAQLRKEPFSQKTALSQTNIAFIIDSFEIKHIFDIFKWYISESDEIHSAKKIHNC